MSVRLTSWVLGILVAAVLVWAYADAIAGLALRWSKESDYLHGFLVLPFSGLLLWQRRAMLAGGDWTAKGSWWALGFLGLAAAMRWASSYYFYALLDPVSLVPCLIGVALLIGGWKLLAWSWPSIVFLVFMVPLPGFLANALSHPLQRVATLASTYVIQTVGVPCVAQGNVIVLAQTEIGVVEACSGLRMMILFLAVCTGTAFLFGMGFWKALVVIVSAGPIAILANVARITTTAILNETLGQTVGTVFFHDLAGWFMMPVAVLLLWGELGLLNRAMLPESPEVPVLILPDASTPHRSA